MQRHQCDESTLQATYTQQSTTTTMTTMMTMMMN
jgi:hypothetical protein